MAGRVDEKGVSTTVYCFLTEKEAKKKKTQLCFGLACKKKKTKKLPILLVYSDYYFGCQFILSTLSTHIGRFRGDEM